MYYTQQVVNAKPLKKKKGTYLSILNIITSTENCFLYWLHTLCTCTNNKRRAISSDYLPSNKAQIQNARRTAAVAAHVTTQSRMIDS